MTKKNIDQKDKLELWLNELRLGKYAAVLRENAIDLDVLPEVNADDLRQLGIPLGDRKRLLHAISAELKKSDAESVEASPLTESSAASVERRQITVLFADLVGSTALSTRYDPEDMSVLIREYQDVCEAVVVRAGGMVADFRGDGIVAFFGYPLAHEDEAERSVQAGLEISEAVSRLTTHDGDALAARVGIATGLVIVGDILGQGRTWEQAVVGETPNLAARLQALALPGGVIIADSTKQLAGGFFEYTALGIQELKGFAKPVHAWSVVGRRAVLGRFDATHEGRGLSPFMGRVQEVDRLGRLWDEVTAGFGRVVEVVGEPGIGKSRLVQALVAGLANGHHLQLGLYCLPGYQNSAFHPLIEQIERAAQVERNEPAATKLSKLLDFLTPVLDDVVEMAPVLAALLSIPCGDRYPPLKLSPAQQKEHTLLALEHLLLGVAAKQPVLLVVEDVHWADPSTLELLGRLVLRVETQPLLIVFTFRPEFEPQWGGQPWVSRIRLSGLDGGSCIAIIEALTEGKKLPTELVARILTNTDGVPLFVEELTKSVLESGFLRYNGGAYQADGPLPPLAVPTTLYDSLMARLDRLALAREVAQIGAVIGRQFSFPLLQSVSQMDEAPLRKLLLLLSEAGLIFEVAHSREREYAFKHALMQDVAYNSLLRSKRKILHARAARILEDRFPELAETKPEILAEHYTQAQMSEQAIDYWRRAGELALKRSAHTEAIDQLRRGLALFSTLPSSQEHTRSQLEMLMALGSALAIGRGYTAPEVEKTYASARALYLKLENDPLAVRASLAGLYIKHHGCGEFRAAIELGEQLLALAEQQRDPMLLVDGHSALALTLFTVGQFVAAKRHAEQDLSVLSLQPSLSASYTIGVEPGVASLAFAGPILWMLGNVDLAAAKTNASLARAEELSHPFSLALALTWAAVSAQLSGDVERTQAMADRATALAGDHGFTYWEALAACWQGWALARQGQVAEGISRISHGLGVKAEMGIRQCRSWCLCLLADAQRLASDQEAALATVDEGLAVVREIGEHFYEAELHRFRGELLSEQHLPEAEECFLRARQIAQRQLGRSWQLRAALSLARLWYKRGQLAEASDLVKSSLGCFDSNCLDSQFSWPDRDQAYAFIEMLS
jgi:class 3 adenylate cyclase/tetratricopeptide (TPR) repeat protein